MSKPFYKSTKTEYETGDGAADCFSHFRLYYYTQNAILPTLKPPQTWGLAHLRNM